MGLQAVRENWERITRLFNAARQLNQGERAAFLAHACGEDTEIRLEVESLLENDGNDDFLESPASAPLVDAFRNTADLTEVGRVLQSRYRLDARMAAGGQAIVYRAWDMVLSRPVVVKVLRIEGRRDQQLQSRLRQESEVLARIDHPGVVGIMDSGELADGSPFLVIQYIEGESLREVLRNGPLNRPRAASILRQLGSALSAAHALGIAHRDLKPENVMVQRLSDGNETVKLIDFGIAKIERSQLDPILTTIMIAGTVRYMAPEQFEGQNSVTSDIYSMAVVACEMLCGYPDIRALPAGTDRRIRRALEAALSFRPADRPKDVRAWSEVIAQGMLSRPRRSFVLIAGGTAAGMAAGAFAGRYWFASRQKDSRVIEYVGPFDPLTQGFRINNDVIGTIAGNSDSTAYDGWRITSSRQGFYYRHLSDRQKQVALERGWKLSVVMRAEQGGTNAVVDFAGRGKRFDIVVLATSGTDLVRLNTQIVPNQQGMDFAINIRERVYRRYELVYDPGLGSAALWVNGKTVCEKYQGHSQFQEDWGVFFGACLYASARAAGTFQSVRFEINP